MTPSFSAWTSDALISCLKLPPWTSHDATRLLSEEQEITPLPPVASRQVF